MAPQPEETTTLPFVRHERTAVAMDTMVTVVVETSAPDSTWAAALDRALAWFARVEAACSRFDPASELMQLCRQPGIAVAVSPLLFEAVAFALEIARLTRGAFDPTVGGRQRERGFTRNYLTGEDAELEVTPASYRDLRLNRTKRTITLRRPLLLDLGAVAKGLAIDLAARELAGFERFCVDAGGDVYAGGREGTAPWRIGVAHPRRDGLAGTLVIQNEAVCTSGDYERPAATGGHHLVDPRTGASPETLASVTVLAPSAMAADALATAAFVLGPRAGGRLLERQGVDGVFMDSNSAIRLTAGLKGTTRWLTSEN